MDKKDNKKLCSHLRSHGLDDTDYWLPVLKERGAHSMRSFVHLEQDESEFLELEAKARNPVEKKALRKLLKIDNKLETKKHAKEQLKKPSKEEGKQLKSTELEGQRTAVSGLVSKPGHEPIQHPLQLDSVEETLRASTTGVHTTISENPGVLALLENNPTMDARHDDPSKSPTPQPVPVQHPMKTASKQNRTSRKKDKQLKSKNKADDQDHHQQESKPKQKQSSPKQEHAILKENSNSLENVLRTKQQKNNFSDDCDVAGSNNFNALVLLKTLGLWKFYSKKLQLRNALCIKPEPLKLSLSIEQIQKADFKKLPYLILHKLMAYDSLCRSDLIPAAENDADSDEESESISDNENEDTSGNGQKDLVNGSISVERKSCTGTSNTSESDKDSCDNTSDDESQDLSDSDHHKLSESDTLSDDDDSPTSSEYASSDESFKSCSSAIIDEGSIPDKIHPVDCLLSLIICSDDFLRQDLFSRLAKCQLAVPFILPDPFTQELTLPLWALRSIIKEWECTNKKGEHIKVAQPMISYKMPIVTFIRIGKHKVEKISKSAILNEVISEYHYDRFFHRDCKGGNYESVLGQGLVDMCWYLPSGKGSDIFPDAVTFLNLHGDARDHPRQTQFLSQISSMCFALLTEKNLQLDADIIESLEKFSSSAGGVTLLSGVGKDKKNKVFVKNYLIDLREKNIAGIKETIRSRIKKKIDHSKLYPSIVDFTDIKKTAILIDEHSSRYKQGSRYAAKIKTLITNQNITGKPTLVGDQPSVKDTFLPLQSGGLWKAWAANDKEIYRQIQLGNKSVNAYTEEIKQRKSSIRKKQLQHVESLTPVMESFIISLLKLGGPFNRNLRNYFLQCLKLELNNLSRESFSGMQHQYQTARKELSLLQNNNESTDPASLSKIKELKKELEELQEEIINSSFGLEHLMRELGQVYEAAAFEPHVYGDNLSRLPKAAAELLIDGYPLELMDGDAAHVPLQWVTAVLQETTKILNDPNIFVLSVLGLQSTGKSTMLNTAFGLQFNVSAGRCTRGAFMQLLPLDIMTRSQTNCKYVLVVDTEGLRAPELDPLKTQKHDNELATFVIGLANMTLINIYGEVPGDMDDILQTSVHAFLRMTKIKFFPSCQFVHQNAGANVSSDVGRAKFTAKLNQFTIEAAKQEKCDKKFRCFNDVIKFNDQTDVHHFPGLWMGDPPMAPVNQGYSHSAQMLKLQLVEILFKRVASSDKTASDFCLSSFQTKVKDLWDALLKENFVFSFKNTQEITAYNSLEAEYCKWDWELRNAMLKWEQVAENEINAAKIEFSSDLAEQKCQELQEYMPSLYEPIKEKMKVFFEGKQSEILAQWKAKFQKRLENLTEELQSHAEKHCRKLGKNRAAISKFEEKKKNFAAKITLQVQGHIAKMKKVQEELNESLNKQKLDPVQLKEILRRELFTYETTKQYLAQKLITREQAQKLQQIIAKSNDHISEADISEILFGGVLKSEQVKKIVWKARETEDELEKEFNAIWTDLMNQVALESTRENINIEHEVEIKLREYVKAKGYGGQLIAKLKEIKTLNYRGGNLEMTLDERLHYTKVKTILQKVGSAVVHLFSSGGRSKTTTDPYLIAALQVTDKVFEKAKKYLAQIIDQKTDFKEGFTSELLHEVDTAITVESEAVKDLIELTHEYCFSVFITVCGYAVPKFKDMADSFFERTDPVKYLEKRVKMPLFTKFKNQYYQTKAEEAIANTLCALLEVPIKDQIKHTISAIMVGQMKGSEHYFSSKMALKVKILSDFHAEDNFEGYMKYVKNVKKCLQERLKHYTVQYSDEVLRYEDDETRLQIAAKAEVSRLITVVQTTVNELNTKEIQEWLSTFSKELVSQLGNIDVDTLLTGFDSLNEINLDNFKHQIQTGLRKLEKNLHSAYANIKCEDTMAQWTTKPHDLLEDLIGCTEQCPFCGEQCDLRDPDHYTEDGNQKHRTAVHRPSCLAGWRSASTQVMTSDFCNSLVASKDRTFRCKKTDDKSHLYNNYDAIYPEWSIPPDPTAETSLYWKWFVGKYNKEIARTYEAKPAEVPDTWSKYEWEEVAANLKDAYKL